MCLWVEPFDQVERNRTEAGAVFFDLVEEYRRGGTDRGGTGWLAAARVMDSTAEAASVGFYHVEDGLPCLLLVCEVEGGVGLKCLVVNVCGVGTDE